VSAIGGTNSVGKKGVKCPTTGSARRVVDQKGPEKPICRLLKKTWERGARAAKEADRQSGPAKKQKKRINLMGLIKDL